MAVQLKLYGIILFDMWLIYTNCEVIKHRINMEFFGLKNLFGSIIRLYDKELTKRTGENLLLVVICLKLLSFAINVVFK